MMAIANFLYATFLCISPLPLFFSPEHLVLSKKNLLNLEEQ